MTLSSRVDHYNSLITPQPVICQFCENAHSISPVITVFYKKVKILRRIQCPVPENSKSCDDRNLQRPQKGAYKPAYKNFPKTVEGRPPDLPADLTEIVAVWPKLPEHIKAAIRALIKTTRA